MSETPLEAWKAEPRSLKASMRVSSTQTVRLPAAAGADVAVVASGLAAPVVGVEVEVPLPPPQAARDRVRPAVATAMRLLRMCFSL